MSRSDLETDKPLEKHSRLTWVIKNHSKAAWPLIDRLTHEREQYDDRRNHFISHLYNFKWSQRKVIAGLWSRRKARVPPSPYSGWLSK